MKGLLRGYGVALTAVFFGTVVLWGVMLIVLPQLTMAERALTAPKRQLDSSIAFTLGRDARTCISVLERYLPGEDPEAPANNGGLGIPSMGGMAVPSAGGMGIPSMGGMGVPSIGGAGGSGASRPYILQCDRATTEAALVRPNRADTLTLRAAFDLPRLAVVDTDLIEDQISTAEEIAGIADDLARRLQAEEAKAFPYSLVNFKILAQASLIPQTEATKTVEDAKLSNKLLGLMGLRFERGGDTYERIGLVTLTRTIALAMAATGLALVVCYPMAYKVALASTPQQAVWLFVGLIIPYAIVEIMRIYAWTTIIDNNGLINSLLEWAGIIAEPIQLKRMLGTVFLVMVYTYVLFMVFPMFNVMNTLDKKQIEAARDLGAPMWRVHWRVVIPHAKPGIAVGCISTFMLTAGAFSVPRIISRGLQSEWFAQTIYNKFFESENSNVGAAYSFAYTLTCFLLVGLFMWVMRTRLKDFARVQ